MTRKKILSSSKKDSSFLLLVVLLFAALTSTSLITVSNVALHLRTQAEFPIRAALSSLRPFDFILLATSAACLTVCIGVEARARAFTKLIHSGPSRYILLTAGTLWFAHAMLAPGLLVTGDAGSHVARVAHLMAAIQDDSSLIWDNDFFIGGPLLTFTGPVFHWTATLFGLAAGDATTGIKALTFLLRIASAWLMFAYLRRLGLRDSSAFLGALFYGGGFAQTYLLSIRSTFPQVVNLACLPALFLCLEWLLRPAARWRGAWCGLVLTMSVLIGNHQPTAVVTCVFAAAYTAWRLRELAWPRAVLLRLACAAPAIGVGAIYFVLPFLLEKSATAENFSVGTINLQWPHLLDMVRWGGAGTKASYAAYCGISVILTAISGIAALRGGGGGYSPPRRACGACSPF